MKKKILLGIRLEEIYKILFEEESNASKSGDSE